MFTSTKNKKIKKKKCFCQKIEKKRLKKEKKKYIELRFRLIKDVNYNFSLFA